MLDGALNTSAALGTTTDTFFKVSALQPGHNYTFTVRARCLLGGQLCGDPATLLFHAQAPGKSKCARPAPPRPFTAILQGLWGGRGACRGEAERHSTPLEAGLPGAEHWNPGPLKDSAQLMTPQR